MYASTVVEIDPLALKDCGLGPIIQVQHGHR
jgi:hypothetical protein